MTVESVARGGGAADGSGATRVSSLLLVDLAGSESARATGERGGAKQMNEAKCINKSLLTLGAVVSRLAEAAESGGVRAAWPGPGHTLEHG